MNFVPSVGSVAFLTMNSLVSSSGRLLPIPFMSECIGSFYMVPWNEPDR